MTDKRGKGRTPKVEQLIYYLFKLTRSVNLLTIHNQRLFDLIDTFRESLAELAEESGSFTLRVQNGRFYFNRTLFSCPPAFFDIASKLADWFSARKVYGLRFNGGDKIWNDQVIAFLELLAQAERKKGGGQWLQAKLSEPDFAWVDLLPDEDYTLVGDGGEEKAVTDGEAEEAGGRRARGSKAKAHSRSLSASAREAYSQALTSVLTTMKKLPTQKMVSVQRTKRVIQNMIDILAQDENLLLGLGTIRDYDDYTYTHSVNVAILSMCLANRLGMSRTTIEQVGLCGLFHDLGKVDIPIDLITKGSRLTPQEFAEVKKHPVYSIRQIMRFSVDSSMKEKFILPPFEHHLGVDLSGYPNEHYREPLSLLGRILSIADHFDALTSSRSYRPVPYTPDMALRIMVEMSGSKLDPILLKVFIDMVGVYPVGSFLLLDTGEYGIVAETSKHPESGRPVIVRLHREGDAFVHDDRVDLSEKDDDGTSYKRNVFRCLHPSEYGIQAADFLT